MHAFHSNWTGPFFYNNPYKKYEIEDFELLTTILSALKWQEMNGDIEMITDRQGAAYYREIGLSDLWNKGIDESLEDINEKVHKGTFWAAGKLYALAKQKAPCIMLDTDFIVWENIEEYLDNNKVVVIHQENLDSTVYPDAQSFCMNTNYSYCKEWDWTVLPCNTALAFFGESSFKDYYVDEATRFMLNAEGYDPLIYMVFAEQRLLSMCAKEKEVDIYTLSSIDELFKGKQTRFTHIWGYKRYLRSHKEARRAFCKRCCQRIKNDYPWFYSKLFQIDTLKEYLKDDNIQIL